MVNWYTGISYMYLLADEEQSTLNRLPVASQQNIG